MIVQVSDYVEAYRTKAKFSRDLHELAGRPQKRELTRFVNERILSEMSLQSDDHLVDVGCGDGCLLRMSNVRKKIGLTATEEEASRLREFGLDTRAALTHSLPLPDSYATAVVCNGVLLLVRPDNIPASLRELFRIAKSQAKIWIGEIPTCPEQVHEPRYSNVSGMLWHLLRTRGMRTFLGKCRQICWAALTGEPIVLNTARLIQFYAEPTEFIRLAKDAGLTLERFMPHLHKRRLGQRRQQKT